MATSQHDLSATVLGGSDELFDFYCQPCRNENLNVEAAGFCQQCHEYLCDACCRYHRKYTVLKNHKILDKASWPKTPLAPKVTDILTETCPKHAGKVLEYFCNDHGDICCSVCLSLDHSSCKNKSYIPDISNGTAKSQEYKTLVENLDGLVALATHEQMQLKLNSQRNDECRSKTLANIKHCRKEVDKLLDQIMDEAVQNATKLHKVNADEIKGAEQNCQSVLTDVAAITTDLEKKAKTSKNNQLFVDMKLTRDRLPAIGKDIQDATGRKISQFKFDKDEKLQGLRTILSAMITLSVRKEGAEVNAHYLQEVNVKSVEDKKDCTIQGIVVVSGDRLVVADLDNVAVKLVDVRQNIVISRLPMSSMPYDVIKTSPTTVAVALGQEGKIELLVVSDVLARSRTINMPGDGFTSLCHIGDNFIILYYHTRAVKKLDMFGRVLSTIYKDNDTNPLFKEPRLIALSRAQDVIYVTDWEANTVTALTIHGGVISIYKSDKLKGPRGVAVGVDGTVYVCSRDNHTVHQLSSTGQHEKILLDHQRGLTYYPQAITYDEDDSRLCVSSASSTPNDRNFVRLFKVEKFNSYTSK